MDLRFRLALVTDGGTGLGREVAARLARVGAAVLVVDPDLAAARATAAAVAERRTRAWSFEADVTRPDDLALLHSRVRDLGGADLLVTGAQGDDLEAAEHLVRMFVGGLATRRGRRDQPGAAVLAAPPPLADELRRRVTAYAVPVAEGRVCGLVSDPGTAGDPDGRACVRRTAATAVDLLARGTSGTVTVASTSRPA